MSPKPFVHPPLPGRPPSPRVCPPRSSSCQETPDTSLDPCIPRALPARPLTPRGQGPTLTPLPHPPPPSQGPGGGQRVEVLGGPGPAWGFALAPRLVPVLTAPPPAPRPWPCRPSWELCCCRVTGGGVWGSGSPQILLAQPSPSGPGPQVTAVYRVPYCIKQLHGLQSSRLFTKQLTK